MASISTSASRAATAPSIASSYQRISGGTPTISVSGTPGPKMRSLRESALERAEAEMAAKESVLPRELELERKKQLGERNIMEGLDPMLRVQRENKEYFAGIGDLALKTQRSQEQERIQKLQNTINATTRGMGNEEKQRMAQQLAQQQFYAQQIEQQRQARAEAEAARQAYAQAARRGF